MAEEQVDLSSGRDVRAHKRKAKQKQETFELCLDVVLDSTQGRKVIWDLISGFDLEGAGVFEDAYTREESLTAYRLGRQSMAKFLLAKLMAPERFHLYAKMVEENPS